MKEKQIVSSQDSLRSQRETSKQPEIFNPGNQVVVKLTKEAQGTMHYKAQK